MLIDAFILPRMWALDLLVAHVRGSSCLYGTHVRPHLRTHLGGNPFTDYESSANDHPNTGDIPLGEQGHPRDGD